MDLVAAIVAQGDTAPDFRLRFGEVTATSPIRVSIAGATAVECRKLASYTPSVAHFVAVLVQQGGTPLVLGQVNS